YYERFNVVDAETDSARDGVREADLVLQLEQTVDEGLGRGRAPGHVDIHRNDAVTAAHHRVRVVVVAAAVRTGTHGDHPARLGHLVVHLAQGRRHLVAQRACHNHHV